MKANSDYFENTAHAQPLKLNASPTAPLNENIMRRARYPPDRVTQINGCVSAIVVAKRFSQKHGNVHFA